MGCFMYHRDDENQLGIEEFFVPFGGRLSRKNHWVKMAEIMPWSLIEEVYAQSMCQNNGRRAIPARVAYEAIFVNEHEDLTDEETVTAIAENPYIQYFLGLKEFTDQPLFDPSMMVHFRKRFSVEDLAKINEAICTGNVPEKIRSVDCRTKVRKAIDELLGYIELAEGSSCGHTAPLCSAEGNV